MMAKMRTRRNSLNKAALELIDGGAQPLDVGSEALELVPSREGMVGERRDELVQAEAQADREDP